MQNQAKVIVSAPEGREEIILISKKNPEQAAIMLRSNTIGINNQGFMQTDKRVAMFKGKTEDLKQFVASFNIKNGSEFPIPTKLVIKESLTEPYPGAQPKVNPTTGAIVTSGGKPVFRQIVAVDVNSQESDERVI
jgi:hypothetical protein